MNNKLLTLIVFALFISPVSAYQPLPIYHGQEPYKNLTTFAVIAKNYGTFMMSCQSHSMSPEFTCNDTLLIVPVWGKAEVGDIVLARARIFKTSSLHYLAHRVIFKSSINGSTYYNTKGDNNSVADPFITEPKDFNWKVVGKWVR